MYCLHGCSNVEKDTSKSNSMLVRKPIIHPQAPSAQHILNCSLEKLTTQSTLSTKSGYTLDVLIHDGSFYRHAVAMLPSLVKTDLLLFSNALWQFISLLVVGRTRVARKGRTAKARKSTENETLTSTGYGSVSR